MSNAAGGGSSYIPGNPLCDDHPAFKFTSTIMKTGKDLILSPEGVEETGHIGNGYFRISLATK